jgi:hypothetical protein
MTSIRLDSHKGKIITIVDLSNKKAPQIIEALKEAQPKIAVMQPKSARLLTNVTNAEVTKDVVNAIMLFAKNNTPFVKASATVGAEKLKSIILSNVTTNVGRSINNFNSEPEAMDWLANQP